MTLGTRAATETECALVVRALTELQPALSDAEVRGAFERWVRSSGAPVGFQVATADAAANSRTLDARREMRRRRKLADGD